MAAGEVTPDGLIAIGQIAKRYQLYSKVTGGQRIDLVWRAAGTAAGYLARAGRRRV